MRPNLSLPFAVTALVVLPTLLARAQESASPVWQNVATAASLPSPSPVDPLPAASASAAFAGQQPQQQHADPVASAQVAKQRRKKHRKGGKQRLKDKERTAEPDEYYYEREDEYGSPKAPASSYEAPAPSYQAPAAPVYEAPAQSYEAPAPTYQAPSYQAPSYQAPSYQAPSYQAPSYQAPTYHDEGYGGGGYAKQRATDDNIRSGSSGNGYYNNGKETNHFNDFLNALIAFLPIGLFLAAIPPNLITINTSTGRRKRDADGIYDEGELRNVFLDNFLEIGFEKMKDSECQKKMFCQMAAFGGFQENANAVQKTFFEVASRSPKFLTDAVGLSEVFEASMERRCNIFKCIYNVKAKTPIH